MCVHSVRKARAVLDQLVLERTPLSRNICYHLLQGCIKRKDLASGRCLYSHIIMTGLDSISVLTDHVIRLFASCSSLPDANKVFSKVLMPSAYTWNTIISAYNEVGESDKAMSFYHLMKKQGATPDRVTFLSVLKASCSTGSLRQVRLIHGHINAAAVDSDIVLGSSLVDVYAKCGSVEEARKVFDKILSRNIVSWGAMMAGYAQQGHGLSTLELFERMQAENVNPNRAIYLCVLKACASITARRQGWIVHDHIIRQGYHSEPEITNSLMDMYCKYGSLDEARIMFDNLHARSLVSWGAIIAGYASHGHFSAAVHLFKAMQQEGLEPDGTIFTSILTGCRHAALLEDGSVCFKSMINQFGIVPNIEHYTCMIDLLGHVGHLKEAAGFVQSMPICPDSVLWTSLLTSCRTYCNVEVARHCFDKLVNLDPNDASLYALMSSIYIEARMWDALQHLQALKSSAGACKKAANAWIEVSDKVHEFVVGDINSSESQNLSRLLMDNGKGMFQS